MTKTAHTASLNRDIDSYSRFTKEPISLPPNQIKHSGQFYTTYKDANTSFSADTFRCVEETTSELQSTATTSEHPGMLLGKVQSGKTRTFISILALAFDNAFDIAIVLSKNSKALIEQTEKRLTSEFSMFIEDGELGFRKVALMKIPMVKRLYVLVLAHSMVP